MTGAVIQRIAAKTGATYAASCLIKRYNKAPIDLLNS